MKVLIKKDFVGYKKDDIVTINEKNPACYGDVAYWLRRCEDGKIDGYCELLEFNDEKVKKVESVIQSNKNTENKNNKNK